MATVYLTHDDDEFALYYGQKALQALEQLAQVRRRRRGGPLTSERLAEEARGCEVIVSYRATPGEAMLFEHAGDLVAFVRCAVDIRNVDVAAASANGVLVTRSTPGFINSVAELIVGMMIDLARGVTDAASTYRAGQTPPARMGTQLAGATLGIIGFGAIGSRMADLGRALEMRVLINDPYVKVQDATLAQLDLGDLLTESDFVVCLAVATPETENLIDAAAFRRMKPGAFFVNVSRGNLVDEAALEAALAEGRIAGAALDVGRAGDQMPSPRLAARSDVIATPHIGGLTPTAIEHQALGTVDQVREILQGRAPQGAVNAEHASRLARLAGG